MTENALSRLVLLLALWPVGCVGGGRDSQDVTDEVIGGFLADVAGRHTGYAGLELSRFRGRVNTEVSNLSPTPLESHASPR